MGCPCDAAKATPTSIAGDRLLRNAGPLIVYSFVAMIWNGSGPRFIRSADHRVGGVQVQRRSVASARRRRCTGLAPVADGSASPETADAACIERGIRRRFGESSAVRYRHCLVAGVGGTESPAAGPGRVGLPLCFLWQAHARSVTLGLALCLYPANRGRSGGNPGMELNSA